jgi:hypothetical protein
MKRLLYVSSPLCAFASWRELSSLRKNKLTPRRKGAKEKPSGRFWNGLSLE